jgi:hypothetical protein
MTTPIVSSRRRSPKRPTEAPGFDPQRRSPPGSLSARHAVAGGAQPFAEFFVSPNVKVLLWLLLLVLCWPVALLALVLYPIVWVLLLPFRIVGIAVDGVLGFLRALFFLPARILGAR